MIFCLTKSIFSVLPKIPSGNLILFKGKCVCVGLDMISGASDWLMKINIDFVSINILSVNLVINVFETGREEDDPKAQRQLTATVWNDKIR